MQLKAFLLCSAMLAAGLTGAYAQTSQRLNTGKANEYGLIYSLPVTAVDIVLVARISEEQPGEFHNYARRHLGITDAISAHTRTATLTGAEIRTRGFADPAQRWLAQFKNGSTVSMLLTPDNIPLGINVPDMAAPAAETMPEETPFSLTPLDGDVARQAITADMARSASTSKRAELAAQRIFELREMRSDILSGQADNMPSDGAAMQLVLDNIAAQEAALTAMFAGTRRTRTVVRKVTVIPDSTDIDNRIVARLSAVDGLIDADNLAGEPVSVSVRVLERGQLPVNDKGQTKDFPSGGVAYRVPGRAAVDVEFRGQRAATATIDVAQLGVVFGLNPTLFSDKREPQMLVYDPATGAVVDLSPARTE